MAVAIGEPREGAPAIMGVGRTEYSTVQSTTDYIKQWEIHTCTGENGLFLAAKKTFSVVIPICTHNNNNRVVVS